METAVINQESIRKQFDCLCKMVLRGERCTYIKQILNRAKKEIPLSELPISVISSLNTTDEYPIENAHYLIMGYKIEVRDDLLAAGLDSLTPIKRDVVLLSFFMGMNQVAIAKLMDKEYGAISYHHRSAIVLLRKFMQERGVNRES